jgi:hypothetical protein
MTRLDQMLTSTVTLGTGVSTSMLRAQQIFSGPFTVVATTGTNLPCEYWSYNFTATVGQYLYGNFTSDNPVSIFVVQQSTYENWVKANTCGNPGDAIASQLITTSYSLSPPKAIPSSGTWTIVIVNSSNAKNAEGYGAAYLSTLGSTMNQTLTTTTTISALVGQSTNIPGFPAASIIVGIMAGLVAIVALRRRTLR